MSARKGKNCFLWFHTWSKWEVTHRYTRESTASVRLVQQRCCEVCGKTQIEASVT